MRRAPVLAVLLGVVMAAPAAAQTAQREPLLGERAFGMAGAVTGSATGPSAAYYNPGGLADTGGGTAIGASLQLRTFRSYTVEDGYTSVLGVEDLSDSGLYSVPVLLGAVLTFGDRDATGLKQHALTAGTLVRSLLDRDLINEDLDLGAGLSSSLEVIEEQQTRWFYAGYSVRPDPQLSLGATIAWSYYTFEYRETWNQVEGIADEPGVLTARNVRVRYDQHHLLARVGAHYRPTDWIQLGVMFQTPGIPLFGGGDAIFQRSTVNEAGGSSFFRFEDQQISPDVPIPWQLRVGGFARLDERFAMGLDVGLTSAVGSANDPVNPLGFEVPTDGDLPPATYFADRYWTDYTFDAALGTEIVIHPDVDLRVGSFFELSGLPVAQRAPDVYMPDRLDRLGWTAAAAVDSGNYDFAVGVGYTYGWGDGLRPTEPFASTYTGTTVNSHEIAFFLSGVTSAATQVALDTYRVMTGQEINVEDEEERAMVEEALESVEAPGLTASTNDYFEAAPHDWPGVLRRIERGLPRTRSAPPDVAPVAPDEGPGEEIVPPPPPARPRAALVGGDAGARTVSARP